MAKKMKLCGCPFCGGQANWTKGDKTTRMPDKVMCSVCFVEIVGKYEPMSALTAWNFRVNDHIVMKGDRMVTIESENL